MPEYTTTTIPRVMQKILRTQPKIVLEEMNIVGDEWELEAASIVLNEGHVFKHRLRNDIECKGFIDKTGIGVIGFVPSTNKHGIVIHEGRKPGSKAPPFAALSEWVAKRLGIPVEHENHYIVVKSIQRNIARFGFKSIPAGGLKYFDRPLFKNIKRWQKQIADQSFKKHRKFR